MGLPTINPAQAPHEKNGEQPWHSFSGVEGLDAASFCIENSLGHTSSAQHGFADSNTTNSDKNMHSIFIAVKL